MTQRETMQAIRALGLSVRVTDGEYRIAFKLADPEKAEASAYYTTDRDDALATAGAMAVELVKQPEPVREPVRRRETRAPEIMPEPGPAIDRRPARGFKL